MKFGHCKNYWWNYNHCCYMSGVKVNDDSYCPDFYEGLSLCGHKVSGYTMLAPRTPLL